MPHRDAVFQCNRRNQTIHGRANCDRLPPPLRIDVGRSAEKSFRQRITESRDGVERGAKRTAFAPLPKSLQHLLHNRATRHKLAEHLGRHRRNSSVQQSNPNRGIGKNHRAFFRRGRSSRISARLPCHRPLPKNSAKPSTFFRRTASERAIFTAAEYVFTPSARTASSSS